MNTNFDQGILLISDFAQAAGCDKLPDVRIAFATPADQAKFKLLIVSMMQPSEAVSAPLAHSPSGSDLLRIADVNVELLNREVGTRAEVERLVRRARAVHHMASKPTITPQEISMLRSTLGELLHLMKG